MRILTALFFAFSMAASAEVSPRTKLSEKDKTEILSVLKQNDELFNAFLKKDEELIKREASDLREALNKTTTPLLKESRKEASGVGTIKGYESFLNPLIKVVETYDLGANYNVFSCPMVKKSWIQDVRVNKEVRNVYAMEMLECGTQDTKF